MSERSSWKRFGLEASGGDMRRTREAEHVELGGDVLGGHG